MGSTSPPAAPAAHVDTGPLWDTHAHLDSDRMGHPPAEIARRALAAGVTDVVVPAVTPETFARVLAVPGAVPALRIHLAWGIHPQVLPERDAAWDDGALGVLERWCREHPPVALGECGLDYRVDLERAPRGRQRDVLRFQLHLAQRLRLPVLLHCLSAHADLLADLRAAGGLPAGGVLHSYSGSAEQLPPFLDEGLHVSFAGPVSWPGARRAPAAARAVPAARLLCETDSPDQAPHPWRRQPNQPAWLPHVVRALAAARGEDPRDTAQACTANARQLFHRA